MRGGIIRPGFEFPQEGQNRIPSEEEFVPWPPQRVFLFSLVIYNLITTARDSAPLGQRCPFLSSLSLSSSLSCWNSKRASFPPGLVLSALTASGRGRCTTLNTCCGNPVGCNHQGRTNGVLPVSATVYHDQPRPLCRWVGHLAPESRVLFTTLYLQYQITHTDCVVIYVKIHYRWHVDTSEINYFRLHKAPTFTYTYT